MVLVGLQLEAVREQEDEARPAPSPRDLHARLPLEKHFHFSLVNSHLLNQRYCRGSLRSLGTVLFQGQTGSDLERGWGVTGGAPGRHGLQGEVAVFRDCCPALRRGRSSRLDTRGQKANH